MNAATRPRDTTGRFMPGDEHRTYCIEEVQFLASCGDSWELIATRMGMTPGALGKALRRGGRADLARPFEAMHNRARTGLCVGCGAATHSPGCIRCVPCGHRARVAKVYGGSA